MMNLDNALIMKFTIVSSPRSSSISSTKLPVMESFRSALYFSIPLIWTYCSLMWRNQMLPSLLLELEELSFSQSQAILWSFRSCERCLLSFSGMFSPLFVSPSLSYRQDNAFRNHNSGVLPQTNICSPGRYISVPWIQFFIFC